MYIIIKFSAIKLSNECIPNKNGNKADYSCKIEEIKFYNTLILHHEVSQKQSESVNG